MPMPRRMTPETTVPLAGGGTFALDLESSPRRTVVCACRGLHCPICATCPRELVRLTSEFAKRGAATVASSSDGSERAQAMAEKVAAGELGFGYDLALSKAREGNLFISTSRGKTSIRIEEPPLFPEPGRFPVNPDRALCSVRVETMPFVRPHFSERLAVVASAFGPDYPARGEDAGPA